MLFRERVHLNPCAYGDDVEPVVESVSIEKSTLVVIIPPAPMLCKLAQDPGSCQGLGLRNLLNELALRNSVP